jgi:hypothetical protein
MLPLGSFCCLRRCSAPSGNFPGRVFGEKLPEAGNPSRFRWKHEYVMAIYQKTLETVNVKNCQPYIGPIIFDQ